MNLKKLFSIMSLALLLGNNLLFVSASDASAPTDVQPTTASESTETVVNNDSSNEGKNENQEDTKVLDEKDVDKNNLNPNIKPDEVLLDIEDEDGYSDPADLDHRTEEDIKNETNNQSEKSEIPNNHCIQEDGKDSCLATHDSKTFVVSFEPNNDTVIEEVAINEGEILNLPNDPKKAGKKFKGWYTDEKFTNKFDKSKPIDSNLKLYALFKRRQSEPTYYSSGSSSSIDVKVEKKEETNKEVEKKNEEKTIEKVEKDIDNTKNQDKIICELDNVTNISEESQKSYLWACENNITTMRTITEARISDKITRGELAKVISTYLMNIKKREVVKKDVPTFEDVQDDSELKDFIILAYQYQVMGIENNGKALKKFNPNQTVTRAEFATVLSRILFGDEFNAKDDKTPFYQNHIEALEAATVIRNTNHKLEEIRDFVFIMLQRSTEVRTGK